MQLPLILLACGFAVLIVWFAVQRYQARWLSLERLRPATEPNGELPSPTLDNLERRSFIGRWLFLAGYRDPRATFLFVSLTMLLIFVGGSLAWLIKTRGLTLTGMRALEAIPGGVGEIFLPIIYLAPWIVAAIVCCFPWLVVQAARRKRVEDVEQDLPVTLELLATLSEAGLGIDGALARVLESQTSDRPLAQELRTFQFDTQGGRSRVECFRRLARRLEVQSLSLFVSAVVQAEQVGAGMASVMRRQADDLRERRRENALALAMTLPVKQLFPMVICFLPAIFVITLGPAFFQFFQYAESLTHGR